MDDERPVPVVIIDDWNTTDYNFHNSPFAGESVTGIESNGELEYEKYLRFDWQTSVDFLVRDDDEVDVSRLKESLKHEVRLLRHDPTILNSSLKNVSLGTGGSPTNTFTEPREAELMLSTRFYGDHIVTLSPSDSQYDTLEQVKQSFTFNP